MFTLQRDGSQPLADQLTAAVTQAIERGRWAEGERLPSVRQLSQRLAVSVYTVTTALERVAARGLIQARAGAGFFVTRTPGLRPAFTQRIEAGLPPAHTTLGFTQQALDTGQQLLPVGSGFLPTDWFAEAIAPASLARFSRQGASAMTPTPAQGRADLRAQLAERLRLKQIPAGADQVLVTFGASQAFDLILRALCQPGQAVLVEDPGYFVLHSQVLAAGAHLVPVARDADGLLPEALEAALLAPQERPQENNSPPRLLFTQTLLHNPTGGSSTPARCHQLLKLAERYNLLVIEDDVYGDLADAQRLRLAQLDGLERVIYLSSFTKVLNPALRLGFIAAPSRLVQRLVDCKVLSVLSGSALEELVISDVLASGKYPKHLARTRDRLARARTASIAALTELGLSVDSQTQDGLFLWCRLPPGRTARDLVGPAQAAGLLLAHGQLFSPSQGSEDRLRLNAAYGHAPVLLDFLRSQLAG